MCHNLLAEMEKVYKTAHENFDCEKLAHKTCAKNGQNHAKLAKMPNIAPKRPKTFNKTREKKQKLAEL